MSTRRWDHLYAHNETKRFERRNYLGKLGNCSLTYLFNTSLKATHTLKVTDTTVSKCENGDFKRTQKKAAFFFLCKTYTLSWYCIFKSRKINFDPITQTDGLIGETIDCYNDIKTDFLGSISRQRAVPQHIWTFQPRNLFAS